MRFADRPFLSVAGRPILIALAAIVVGWLVSLLLPGYLVYLGISAVVIAVALIGLGIVTGTAGMIALCQLTFAAVGAWVVAWLNTAGVPGGLYVWIPLGGIAAGVVGVLIGLPALRLRGVNLAVVTLSFAFAIDVILFKVQFPGTVTGQSVPRPELVATDRAYFLFAVIVLVVVALAVWLLQRSRVGSGWRSVAFSERGTASAGSSVRLAKLSAFAVSATIAGIAGGLIAGQVGNLYPTGFTTLQSLALYVLSVVTGSYFVAMGVVGGILWVLIPELLKRWGIPQDWAFIVFGVLGIQTLTTNSNLGEDLRRLWRRLRRSRPVVRHAALEPLEGEALRPLGAAEGPGTAPLLEVDGLSVVFGSLRALDGVTLTIPERSITALIGPNGAGKSTFVDAISGFLPQHLGEVRLGGTRITRLPPHRRARLGLRRSYQQDRVPPSLTVGAYMRFIAGSAAEPHEVDELLEYFGCPPAGTPIASVDVGTRRMVEVAANLAAKPRLLVLDEPAAGLAHEEHVAFAQRLKLVPSRYGAAVLIIEHDLELVRSVADSVVVLDFGRVLASGDQDEVLRDPAVIKAYMGEAEML
jgi:branched-chain amino acid transport system permease protein